MAVKALDSTNDSSVQSSLQSSKGGNFTNRLMKIDIVSEYRNKELMTNIKPVTLKMPNPAQRKLHYMSSFPLAANIYKSNSDDIKISKRGQKKMQKSVLTLPNEKVVSPEMCTVSDVNDTEYCNKFNEKGQVKSKKRRWNQKAQNTKFGPQEKQIKNSSRLSTYGDYNSAHPGKPTFGNIAYVPKFKNVPREHDAEGGRSNGHRSMWDVLRNLNELQFRPSPPASEDSSDFKITRTRRCKGGKKFKRQNKSVIGTCRTEEFAYISSIEMDSRCPTSFSHSSSFDRITVINNGREFNEIFTEIKKEIDPSPNFDKASRVKCEPNKKKKLKKKSIKLVGKSKNTELTNSNENGSLNDVNALSFKSSANYDNEVRHASNLVLVKNATQVSKLSEKSIIEQPLMSSVNSIQTISTMYHEKPTTVNIGKKEFPAGNDIKQVGATLKKDKNVPNKQCFKPKLTEKDIKRRLLRLKYPIVILGKDELSSTVSVDTYDAPQFIGLDQYMWPFMKDWTSDNSRQKPVSERNFAKSYCKTDLSSLTETTDCKHYDGKKIRKNSTINADNNRNLPKNASNIKDKIMKFLYKKSSKRLGEESLVDGGDENTGVIDCDKNPVSHNKYAKEPKIIQETLNLRLSEEKSVSNNVMKHQWAKAKRASDFVENILTKIKSGFYYNPKSNKEDNSNPTIRSDMVIKTSSSIHSTTKASESGNITPKVVVIKKDVLELIPGFEPALPEVEVKTLNINKIEIKHCTTKITVQFDVKTFPQDKIITAVKSSHIIPLEEVNRNTKLFKCKTAIPNCILPAELCTILPKMIRGFSALRNSRPALPTLPSIPIEEINLISIPEIVNASENVVSNVSVVDVLLSSTNLKARVDGIFGRKVPTIPGRLNNVTRTNIDGNESILDLLPRTFNDPFMATASIPINLHVRIIIDLLEVNYFQKTTLKYRLSNSMALEIYRPSSKWVKTKGINFFYVNLIIWLWYYYKIMEIITNMIKTGMIVIEMNKNSRTITITFCNRSKNKVPNIIPLYAIQNCDTKIIELCNNHDRPKKKKEFKAKQPKTRLIKIHRKSKSTSNISSEKQYTSINKITNMEVFFKVLGWKKYCDIFDDHYSKKILGLVQEIRKWKNEINSKQAFLILLLSNKRETAHLIRFRALILQGIAMNRITRASELDMEIEVIERENIKTSQIEGISYLPASSENCDILLEELHWIAKTTASDYQRPFDAGSEKLLKSLLEKRKQLNPSYLRVMARYVGLGLLKSPKNVH